MTTPRVSVVIPTRNGGPRLLAVVASVLAQSFPEPYELLIVDSGSTDGTLELLHPLDVIRIPPASFGHGTTRNLAIGMSQGEIVALLAQDAVPETAWLRELVAALDADPAAAGAYSRQIPRADHPAWVRHHLESYAASQETPRVQSLTPESFRTLGPLERLHAVAFDNVASAVRKSVWREHPFAAVGFAEDLEWSRRVLLAGHRTLYVPSSRVIHSHDRGALYELRRTYACHRALLGLFDLRLVPDVGTAIRGALASIRQRRGLVRRDPNRRFGDLIQATTNAMASLLGQYLGGKGGPLLDRLLARGV